MELEVLKLESYLELWGITSVRFATKGRIRPSSAQLGRRRGPCWCKIKNRLAIPPTQRLDAPRTGRQGQDDFS